MFATIPEPASKLSIYGGREVHESGTQNEVAKALRGREKEGLVTIPNNFHSASLRRREMQLAEE